MVSHSDRGDASGANSFRGRGSKDCGGGHKVTDSERKYSRCYAIFGRFEEEDSNTIIIGIILFFCRSSSILFD